MSADAESPRIFISYKRDADPDEAVALGLFRELSQRYPDNVFIDQTMRTGTDWPSRIEAELRKARYMIPLLSAQSAYSEMVAAEIETAHRLAKELEHPKILPVRLNYREPLPYPLSAYLNHIQWAFWKGHDDTARLVRELEDAISNGGEYASPAPGGQRTSGQPDPSRPSPSAPPEMSYGAVDAQSNYYIERESDDTVLSLVKGLGVTIHIKGARQMGKSSLLLRAINEAAALKKNVAYIDFQLIDKVALADADSFFQQFCTLITDALGLEDQVDDYWAKNKRLGYKQRCTRYMGLYILKELGSPLVLAMDEVEVIFSADFYSEFFSMLRNWHNNRAMMPLWKNLTIVMVTSTEAYLFIESLTESPFNVAEGKELVDFTLDQVGELNRRYGSPLRAGELGDLMGLLNGHPYLVRRALYEVASGRTSASALLAGAAADDSPFGDHLRNLFFRISGDAKLVDGMKSVLTRNACQDDHVLFRLRGAGLVRIEGRTVQPRCRLYAEYFREHLHA